MRYRYNPPRKKRDNKQMKVYYVNELEEKSIPVCIFCGQTGTPGYQKLNIIEEKISLSHLNVQKNLIGHHRYQPCNTVHYHHMRHNGVACYLHLQEKGPKELISTYYGFWVQ